MRLQTVRARPGLALLCLGLLLAPYHAAAADKEDVADLRRLLREVQDQNRELSRRLKKLEGASAAREKATPATVGPTPYTGPCLGETVAGGQVAARRSVGSRSVGN
jgi:hypothetical protein